MKHIDTETALAIVGAAKRYYTDKGCSAESMFDYIRDHIEGRAFELPDPDDLHAVVNYDQPTEDDATLAAALAGQAVTVSNYLSAEDGAEIIHVDTPHDWPENSEGPLCRIYLNDDTDSPLFDNTEADHCEECGRVMPAHELSAAGYRCAGCDPEGIPREGPAGVDPAEYRGNDDKPITGRDVIEAMGGDPLARSHWDEDPDYPVCDWQAEVENDDTRQGYHKWARDQREQDELDSELNGEAQLRGMAEL